MRTCAAVAALLVAALASSDGMPLQMLSTAVEPVNLGAANEKVLVRPLEDKACGAFWFAVAEACEAGTHISYGRAPLTAAKIVKKIEQAKAAVLDPAFMNPSSAAKSAGKGAGSGKTTVALGDEAGHLRRAGHIKKAQKLAAKAEARLRVLSHGGVLKEGNGYKPPKQGSAEARARKKHVTLAHLQCQAAMTETKRQCSLMKTAGKNGLPSAISAVKKAASDIATAVKDAKLPPEPAKKAKGSGAGSGKSMNTLWLLKSFRD